MVNYKRVQNSWDILSITLVKSMTISKSFSVEMVDEFVACKTKTHQNYILLVELRSQLE